VANLNSLAQPIIIPPFVICDKIKARTQLDVDRFHLTKRLIECLVSVRPKELAAEKPAQQPEILSMHKPVPRTTPFRPFSKSFAIRFPFQTSLIFDKHSVRWAYHAFES